MANMSKRELGWLVIRVGIGVLFIKAGWPKLTGGPAGWRDVGGAMSVYGITGAATFWGFMAAVAECIGGVALVLGILVRPFALLMCFTMITAVLFTNGSLHPLSMALIFVGYVLGGSGVLSLGARINGLHGKWYQ